MPISVAKPQDVAVGGRVTPEFGQILTQPALAFIAKLHREFEPRRQELLARRAARQREFDAGKRPDFLPETAAVRQGEWRIASQPQDLLDRRVEITVPTDRKMGFHSANPCAATFLAGFADADGPTS